MAKREAPKIETEQISIRIGAVALDKLDRLSEVTGVKRSQLIHRAIEEYLDRRASEIAHKPARR